MKVTNLLYWVKDLDKSVSFYQSIGFTVGTHRPQYAELSLGDFGITLVPASDAESEFASDANATEKGLGAYLYVQADHIDEMYNELVKKGINLHTKPRDWEWGNREFIVKDPDGYKLCFWQVIGK